MKRVGTTPGYGEQHLLFLATLLGCGGAILGCDAVLAGPNSLAPKEGAPLRTDGPLTVESACSGDTPRVAQVPLRRLTRSEYENTVADLFGFVPEATESFVADDGSSAFASNNISPVTTLHLEQYHHAAEAIAQNYLPSESLVADCGDLLDATCVERALRRLGRDIFRRPLSDDELASYVAAALEKQTRSDFWDGLALALRALLVSPSFLYRPELPPAGADAVLLDDFEVATRLSFTLWGTTPDDLLLRAAANGALSTPEGLRSHAERLLDNDRSKRAIAAFHSQWLGITRLDAATKDAALYPNYNAALRSAMVQETEFVVSSLVANKGSLTDLFTTNQSHINAELAALYGVTSPGSNFAEATLPASERSGVLTHASVMAAHSLAAEASPILRGKFIRTNILCSGIPEPPPGVDVSPPPVDPTLTTKERFALHRAEPSCAGCHELMDPIGFGFQHYDAIGSWTDSDGDYPVDATGQLLHTDNDGEFDGVPELAVRLSQSVQAQQCYVRQWHRFALGRVENDAELCSVARAHDEARATSFELREIILQLVTGDAFRLKAAEAKGASKK